MDIINTILVSLLFAGAAYVVAFLIGKFSQSSIEGKPELRMAEQAIPRRSLMEQKFEMRTTELTQELGKLSAEVGALRRRRFVLEKELVDARREADSPIRVIGKEGSTPVRFRAWTINRQVQAAIGEGKVHPTLDSDWATPQIVEVWAENLNDARKELQRIYPPPLGFTILNVKLESGEDAPLEEE